MHLLKLIIPVALLIFMIGCTSTPVRKTSRIMASEEEIEYIRNHDLKPYIGRAIERGQIVRGMSKEDVEFVRGEPRTVREEEGRTVWVYGSVTQRELFYFEDGKLVDKG